MSLHLVLVEPEIHWNTGNLGRTALAVDATLHLIEPLGFTLDDKNLRRAGLDYWPRVRLRVWPDWARFEQELPRLGEPFLFTTGAARDYWDVRYPDDAVLIFGRESAGLPRAIVERFADCAVRIPMGDPALRSLNLSTAGALAAYEVIRQRRGR